MKLNGRYPWCPDCEGRGQLPCTVCRGGHADCERCEGTDSELCATCERLDTLFKGEPVRDVLAMARELVTLRAEKAKPRLITVSSGGTYLSSEDFNAALRRLELERDEARAKAAQLEDCGQSGVCELSPGCVRHFLERNAELVNERDLYKTRLDHAEADAEQAVAILTAERDEARAERDRAKWACNAYYHDLARIGSLCEMTADEYPLKAVERTVRQFAEAIKERDEARAELERVTIDRNHAERRAREYLLAEPSEIAAARREGAEAMREAIAAACIDYAVEASGDSYAALIREVQAPIGRTP